MTDGEPASSVPCDASAESRWRAAVEAARYPRQATAWQGALAEALEAALRPDAVGVFLCSFGDMLDASSVMAPERETRLGQELVREFLPRMQRDGLTAPGALFVPTPRAELPRVVTSLYDELLEPASYAGMFGSVLHTEDGMVAGWIAVFSRSPAPERFAEVGQRLWEVCRTAEETIRACQSIGSAVGARFPVVSTHTLSPREREVARLAAEGFSDLNIAQQLGISEGTVGQHLHAVYRKLGVSSRTELGTLL